MVDHGESLSVGHFSDLHYSTENLTEADRCFTFAVNDAIRRGCQLGVISGDSTDHRLDAHTPALRGLAQRVHQLSGHMPVLMLQGTFSHEPPGTLDLFSLIAKAFPVYVADRIHQVALRGGAFLPSAGAVFSGEEINALMVDGAPDAVMTCVPTVNKAALAACVGATDAATAVGDYLAAYLHAAGKVNRYLRTLGVRTLGVSHGTVNGCQTEHGVPMAGFDHEFSVGALFDAECDGFLLGHIHRAQQWERAGHVIAYPGSIGRFHYGEQGTKHYLVWSVNPGRAEAEPVVTPARETLCIDFDGPPNMEALARRAVSAAGGFVRIRWCVDEGHRQFVDRDAILALFGGAAEVKLEGRVLPAVRSRAEGISRVATLPEKLARWSELTQVDAAPLQERLAMLGHLDAQTIADQVMGTLSGTPAQLTLDPATIVPRGPQFLERTASALGRAPAEMDWLNDDLFAPAK